MNATTIVTVFDRPEDAAAAIEELEAAGASGNEISTAAKPPATGAGPGLAEVDPVNVPGIGAAVITGPLAAAMRGESSVGGSTSLVGGLIGLGVPDDDANAFAEAVRRGGILVAVEVESDRAQRTVEILDRHGPIDLDRRRDDYRADGWKRFDETAEAGDERPVPGELPAAAVEVDRDAALGAADQHVTIDSAAAGTKPADPAEH
jgi:hypothetical protein